MAISWIVDMQPVSRDSVDDFLAMCLRHYPNSLAMRFASPGTRAALLAFMKDRFTPAWREEILQYMDREGMETLDPVVALEKIHSDLYLGQGFAMEENRIFRETDPEGFKKFMDASTRTLVEERDTE